MTPEGMTVRWARTGLEGARLKRWEVGQDCGLSIGQIEVRSRPSRGSAVGPPRVIGDRSVCVAEMVPYYIYNLK
jgi:hypothetical protein